MPGMNEDLAQQLEDVGGPWEVTMLDAPTTYPGKFCYNCVCPCFGACSQRQEILELTGEPYICCGGLCPCGPLGTPQDPNCIYAEACCCLGCAISGNRWILQTRFLKRTDPCDSCLMVLSSCLSCLACILKVGGADEDLADGVAICADLVAITVSGCMLTQQQVEVEKIRESGQKTDVGKVLNYLPPAQQEMMALKK